jgi:hypothetical protein
MAATGGYLTVEAGSGRDVGDSLSEGRKEREERIDAQKGLTGPRQISLDIQRKSRESRVLFATRMVW